MNIKALLILFVILHIAIFISQFSFGYFDFLFYVPGFVIFNFNFVFGCFLLHHIKQKKPIKYKIIYVLPIISILWLAIYTISTNIEFNKAYSDIINGKNNYLATGKLELSDDYHYDYDAHGYAKIRTKHEHRVLSRGSHDSVDVIMNQQTDNLRIKLDCGIHNSIYCEDFFSNEDQGIHFLICGTHNAQRCHDFFKDKNQEVRVYFHKLLDGIGYTNVIISIQHDDFNLNLLPEYKKFGAVLDN